MEIFSQQAAKTKKMLKQKAPPEKNLSSAINIQSWYEGVCLYEAGRIDESIAKFKEVKQSAKMLVNIGCCYLRKNDIQTATESFQSALDLDSHLSIASFMLGLTNYLQNIPEESMRYFDKAFTSLRGNRFVDYRQLGFNYKLYDCEILTNKAVVAAKLKQFDEAKNYLLQAFESKAEKRHDRIFDCIQRLQSGEDFQLYIPPKSEVFRPPKAAVANIKKKDYLGNSKVISTDSMEDCYACFSGIKEQVKAAKEASKDEEKSNGHKPVTANRSNLLSDISKGNRRKTLRRITPPPQNATNPQIGRVLENEGSNIKTRRYSLPPQTPLPTINLEDDDEPKRGHKLHPRSKSAIHDGRSRSAGCAPRPNKPLPQLDTNNNITSPSLSLDVTVRKSQDTTETSASVRKSSSSLKISEDQLMEKIPETGQDSVDSSPIDTMKEVYIDVQFNFVQKVRLPASFNLNDITTAIKKQQIDYEVPSEMEICYHDDIGRQFTLSEQLMPQFIKQLKDNNGNKVYCFPSR